MNSMIVCKDLFKKAKLLHEQENYFEAAKLLQETLQNIDDLGDNDKEMISKIFVLYGWNIIALRDFSGLTDFEEKICALNINMQPEFELIRIWILGIQGKTQEAILKADIFLKSQGPQIHDLHPDFLMVRGRCYSQAGNPEQPIMDCEIAYSLFNVQNRGFEAGRAANILGLHYGILGDYPKAIDWYTKANKIFNALKLRTRTSILTLNQGIIHYKFGQFTQSIQLLNKSLDIGVKGHWLHRQCFANIALGCVYRMTRQFNVAQRHLNDGLAQAQSLSMAREEALALEFLGDIDRDIGNFAKAQRYYEKTLAIGTSLAPEGDIVSETHRRIGECYTMNGDFISAQPHLKKALKMTRTQGDRFEEAVTLRVMAESSSSSGNPAIALDLIISSCDILDDIGANFELAISRLRHAQILLAGKDNITVDVPVIVQINQAWHFAIDALHLFQTMKIDWWTSQARRLVQQITSLLLQQEMTDHKIAAARIAQEGKDYNPQSTIIHKSMGMTSVLKMCDIYAPDDVPVLVGGETGTGKELVARRLHEMSKRPGKLVTVNVASISPSLFEREFFGHVKGSFSGADKNSFGFAEQAHRGTLFLDEIGDLPMDLQPKLLRLIQNGSFHAVGDPKERSVDIRLVAATNVDLFEAVQNKTFREDLFYRLEVLTLEIPPLRKRTDDIILLMEHFLTKVAGYDVTISEYLNPTSEKLLLEYAWPGNVREIISVCRKLHLQITKQGSVMVELGRNGDVCILTGPGYLEMKAEAGQTLESLNDPQLRLKAALTLANGNRAKAARLLSVGRSTVYRQIKEFGL